MSEQQERLDGIRWHHEATGWFENMNNFGNHRVLLALALDLTEGDVIEFGSGATSTPYLRNYCINHKRKFYSYDYSKQWAQDYASVHIEDWEKADIWKECGVCLVDHSPGEDRHLAVMRMFDKADIQVLHDSELGGAGDYKFEPVIAKFKYQLHYNRTRGGAGATMVSNKIDVSQFKGLYLSGFQLE